MIDLFGRNPLTVPALLQFLTVLPEELCSNTKIPVTVRSPVLYISPFAVPFLILSHSQDQEYRERSAHILTTNSKRILDLLSMYIQASGTLHFPLSDVPID